MESANFALGIVPLQFTLQSEEASLVLTLGIPSKEILQAKKLYNVFNKELLACRETLQHWCHLSEDTENPADIQTDGQK